MPRRSAAAILSVPMSKPRYTAVESQLMISPSNRSAIPSASALLPVAVGPRTATALALFTVALVRHGSPIAVRLTPDTTENATPFQDARSDRPERYHTVVRTTT